MADAKTLGESRPTRRALIVLLVLVAAWGAAFVARSSFTLGDQRYFVLFDDAMISMSYARNAASGQGLVWTPGNEPVEGFTNPLWTGWMVLVNLVPLSLAWRSLLVQATSLALLLVLVARVRALALAHFSVDPASATAWLPAAVLTGFHYNLCSRRSPGTRPSGWLGSASGFRTPTRSSSPACRSTCVCRAGWTRCSAACGRTRS